MDYQNGKIYVIRNHVNLLVYVGSTTQALSKRMAYHRSDYKRFPTYKLYQACNEIGIDEFHIELIEMFPCECKDELQKREGHFIREYDSYNNGYNGRIEGRTRKEYREANKQEIAEQKKGYRQAHKQEIAEQKKGYCQAHKQEIAEQKKVYREANKVSIAERKKVHYEANKDAINERRRQQYSAKKLIDDATELTL
jgi:group I intron endonuclease